MRCLLMSNAWWLGDLGKGLWGLTLTRRGKELQALQSTPLPLLSLRSCFHSQPATHSQALPFDLGHAVPPMTTGWQATPPTVRFRAGSLWGERAAQEWEKLRASGERLAQRAQLSASMESERG